MNTNLIIANIGIRQDSEGRYCLNDLHRASGGENKHRPKYWLESKQAIELIEELSEGGIPPSEQNQPLSVIRGGNNQGTYACKELVYAYAMWNSSKFHLAVIRAYNQMVTAKPKLSKDTSFLPEFRKARALTMITNVADHICARFPNLGTQSQQVIYASLVNPVAGDNVVPLPILEYRTYSATEVGQKLGISSTMVGRIANKLNLKNEQYGIFVLDKSPHSDKQVEVFRYNDKAVEKIAEELKNLNESEGQ